MDGMGDPEDVGVVWQGSMFEPAARAAFRFLTDRGFTGTSEHDPRNPPSRVAVRFECGLAIVVESELATASEGALTLHTFVRADGHDHLLGPASADGVTQLSRALDDHAAAVRDILGPF
jgi:hypothetical protein